MKNANLLDDPGKNERSPLHAGLGIAGAVALAAVLLIAFLVTHPVTAPGGDGSEASSPPAQSEGLPSTPPESQPPAQTAPMITTEDPEGAMALEELLGAEQLEVFTAAVDVYLHLFGGDTDEVNFWENGRQSPQEWETVEIGGMEYTKSWGPYANYADFDALIRSVFSEQFWEERNNVLSNGLGLFMNVDGALYYISVGGGSGYDYNWDVPDTYRLVERTDDTVTFTIVGHYASIFPREDGTYGHTAEFPARMVLTEDGWRIDQLYLHGVDYHMLPQPAGLED